MTAAFATLLAARCAGAIRQDGAGPGPGLEERYYRRYLPKARMKDGNQRKVRPYNRLSESNFIRAPSSVDPRLIMGKGQSDKALVSFNAGEWSPRLDARTDLEKASSACRRLENFLIESYGSARRRPGTQFITSTRYGGTRKSTLWRFQFSTTTNYAIEVGHEYMRFATNGAPVLDGGVPYEISTIYQENDLFEIQFFQVNDVVFITHPNYPIHLLSRVSALVWTIEEVEFMESAVPGREHHRHYRRADGRRG